jgi:hypothetical protein
MVHQIQTKGSGETACRINGAVFGFSGDSMTKIKMVWR